MSTPKPAAVPTEGALHFLAVDALARDLGNKCTRTIKRLAASDPDFPKFVVLGNRFHVAEHEWENYKKLLMERGTQIQPLADGMKVGGSPGRPRKVDAS